MFDQNDPTTIVQSAQQLLELELPKRSINHNLVE